MAFVIRSCCRASLTILLLVGASPTGLAADPADAPLRPASQQEYWAQYDKGDWAATIAAAQMLVSDAREKADKQPQLLAETLSMLGDAQVHAGDYVSAEASYTEALDITERIAGTASGQLLAPLRGLGLTYALSGKHEQAVPYLERGLLISHRSRGLYDISQQVLLRQLVTSQTKVGNLSEAMRQANYLLRVGERAYGRGDPRIAPLLCFVARWHAEAFDFTTARMRYREAIEIVEAKQGKNAPALVDPLRGLASTYTLEIAYASAGGRPPRDREPLEADGTVNEPKTINPRFIDDDGQDALLRALRILESQPEPPLDDVLLTLLELGDWFQIKHQPDKAIPHYRRAAALATQAPEDSAAAAILSFPQRIYYPMPILATRNRTLRPDQVEERFVQVEFTVTAHGDVDNARVTDQNGTSRQASESLQAIRAARFRPKFVNGEPVDTPGMVLRETFRMRKQTEPGKTS